jgi:hypothetical protein
MDHAFAAAGGFGCALAGYAVATRKPAEALLVAAAGIASQIGIPFVTAALFPPPPDVGHLPSDVPDAAAAGIPDDIDFGGLV